MCEFDDCVLNYSILNQKTNRRVKKNPKHIQSKDYTVYEELRSRNDWYWTTGEDTAGSYSVREEIKKTKQRNYHQIAKAKMLIKM